MVMAKRKGTPATPKQEKEVHQSKPWTLKEWQGKPVWDWMQLLIVPFMLVLISVAFTWQQNVRQNDLENQRVQQAQKIESQRVQQAQKIENQRAQDLTLQGYLDQMSTLVLEDLDNPTVRDVMRARTLTTLETLDPSH